MCGDEEFEHEGTEDWLNAIDRGRLWHVPQQTYSLFYAVEEVVREHFTRRTAPTLTEGSKAALIATLKDNEEILFQWCMPNSKC